MPQWDQRFFSSTRGQIVTLLRRQESTVDELASRLDLTDNAVRSHLTALERDGLAEQAGMRRGVSKPAVVYRLTQEAGAVFPKADGPVLRGLLDVLQKNLSEADFQDILDKTAATVVAQFPPSHGTLRERIEQSIEVLEALGGLAEIEETDANYLVRGFGCPFAAAGWDCPATCQLAATCLTEYINAPVEARCDLTDRQRIPRCLFSVERENDVAGGID